ncbi:MAG: nucleoside-diphosphate kinase [Candidatus Pacebacteria bacterium]|nr:nucleoside-diphosphate kinase [Candidatus Paceibacterota bacterium]
MAREVAYVLITPYTIRKSRTGAILSRLFGRMSACLVATQMVGLTHAMAKRFASTVRKGTDDQDEMYRQLIRSYITENMTPEHDGYPHRSLLLVFCGENAREELASVTGRITISADSGETIRNAYGDLVWNPDGTVRYFEPAVLTCEPDEPAENDLNMWMDFLADQPALLENVCQYNHPERVQQTLVLIKPDSWQQRSARPGAMIDMFSRTGLRIIGCKLCRISVAQGLQFYGPVQGVLQKKLAPTIGKKARKIVEETFSLALPASLDDTLAREVGIPYADDQFERIIEFMTGRRPSSCSENHYDEPGTVMCLALVYEGEDAVHKIRDVLGPTDPTKAPHGTIRREFGSDIMVNAAHASDSPDNAQREMSILKLRESNFADLVNQALQECK